MAVDSQLFKETLAHWASGVTVVTTLSAGRSVGITASSFTSVSLQPPQVLICVAKKLFTNQAIMSHRAFAVSILNESQLEIGMRFAGLIPEVEDRFAGLEVFQALTGCPLLKDALAWVDCRLHQTYDGDDHTIFVGEVVAAGSSNQTTPLLYYNRRWQRLAATPLTG